MKSPNRNIIIATHVWSDGPSQALREYLIDKKVDFVWLGHPLYFSLERNGSGFEVFSKGKEFRKKYLHPRRSPMIIKYFLEIILNLFFVYQIKPAKNSVYIGYDNLNTLSGLFLKKVGLVSKVIYYVVDYTPKRFENPLLNSIYHKIDQFCVKYSDETWNLNERAMNDARRKYHHFNAYQKGFSIQKEVPMGFWKRRINLKGYNQIAQKTLVFMGNIIKKQGVQFVVDAIPQILAKVPDFKLIIVGDGDYLDSLKKHARNSGIEKAIEFKGFVKEHKDVEDILLNSALAIALYEEGDKERNYTYYADPGKIKTYLGCGLPILLSSVPTIAKNIEINGCGAIVSNDPREIAEKVISILSCPSKLRLMRQNVLKYRENFDWEYILPQAINKIRS
jgi:glycosyltransferase involved in cell wall biosynthesis